MANLYELSKKKLLNDERYNYFLSQRGVRSILYYTKPELRYPTDEEILGLNLIAYRWKSGDSLTLIANDYYNSYDDWWMIAYFNKISCEYELRAGDLIYIPTPRDEIFKLLNGRDR